MSTLQLGLYLTLIYHLDVCFDTFQFSCQRVNHIHKHELKYSYLHPIPLLPNVCVLSAKGPLIT